MPPIDPVTAAVDAALDAYLDDPKILFESEGARLSAFFRWFGSERKEWEKPSKCMWRGCSAPTIKRSHALQRSFALERIAEGGHVCTPDVDKDGALVVSKVGVGRASTFPGFCETHELVFGEFEETGEIESVRHGVLQAFRTMCREISRRRFILQRLDAALRECVERRTDYLKKAALNVDGEANIRIAELKGDPIEEQIAEGIVRTQQTLRRLERLYDALATELQDRDGRGDGEVTILRLPLQLPVALSGIVLIDYRKRSERVRVAPCAIGVVPQAGGSVVFVATLRHHRQFLKSWEGKLKSALPMLDLVEGWITHGTDHWFIKPSVWERLGPGRRERILAQLQSLEGVPSADPAEPIFDDLRRMLVGSLRKQAVEKPSVKLAAYLASQEAKLAPF